MYHHSLPLKWGIQPGYNQGYNPLFACPETPTSSSSFPLRADPPSPTADRTLKLVTKTIQNLANLVEFKAKESFMIYLNAFIKDHMPLMTRFVNEISVSPPHTVELLIKGYGGSMSRQWNLQLRDMVGSCLEL